MAISNSKIAQAEAQIAQAEAPINASNFNTGAYNPLYGNPLNINTPATIQPAGTPVTAGTASATPAPSTTTPAQTTTNTGTVNPIINTAAAQSAYDTLLSEFQSYGLGSLVEPLKIGRAHV